MANSNEMDRLSDIEASLQRLTSLTERLTTDVGVLKTDNRDIKQAIWRLTEIVTDHSERFTSLEKSMDTRFQAVNERLDRLIAMNLRERTESIERLARIEQTANEERLVNIEHRLTRLEERD